MTRTAQRLSIFYLESQYRRLFDHDLVYREALFEGRDCARLDKITVSQIVTVLFVKCEALKV